MASLYDPGANVLTPVSFHHVAAEEPYYFILEYSTLPCLSSRLNGKSFITSWIQSRGGGGEAIFLLAPNSLCTLLLGVPITHTGWSLRLHSLKQRNFLFFCVCVYCPCLFSCCIRKIRARLFCPGEHESLLFRGPPCTAICDRGNGFEPWTELSRCYAFTVTTRTRYDSQHIVSYTAEQ